MKKENNFKNLNLETIVDDPFAQDEPAPVAKKPVRKTDKTIPKAKVMTEVKETAKTENTTKKSKSSSSKKADELTFNELTDYVNMLPAELFREKLSTVQIPQEFVELIKQVSYETGKPAFQVATALVQMSLSRMKGDITEMLDRKSKKKINLI
ncbi:hypothetical protein [Chondrinema litorale]|uniref:hypothetical protein n=1 Tax=Chondrinema litorale TaxID=2994555 RepID=UPI002542FA37|nr:hypothetical protein [Chondrinema litorale]UZR99007.1 hypothetical protein OQ292_33965 [Chondrinema litorale]